MTVNIKSETLNELEEIASQYGLEADDLLNKALKNYRRQLEETKIEVEKQHYLRQHAFLKKNYLGRFIALHHGQIVDHDQDFETLHRRVRQKYGREAILMRRVEEEPDRLLMWRSPRFHWSKPV